MTKPSLESKNDNHNDEFTRAIPDPSLYEQYSWHILTIGSRKKGEPGYQPGGGFDYLLIDLYTIRERYTNDLENENFEDEREIEQAHLCIEAYDRIYEADEASSGQWREYFSHAEDMQYLFNVDQSIFDPWFDRQCEIDRGYIKKSYMFSALRSFAWTLADYCEREGVTPNDVSYSVLRRLVDFIAEHDWLNYDGVSHCRGLCDAPDIYVFYAPDGLPDADRNLIPSPPLHEDYYAGPSQVLGNVPTIVRSLNALRRDLAFVYPAIQLLFDELAIHRNYSEILVGDDADLIYTWCGFVYAARSPFSLEHGSYTYPFTRMDDDRDAWYKQYREDLTLNPTIDFRNKRFFFCDLDEPFDESEHPTVQKVIEYGGIVQGSVTALTNYLVVNPPPPHKYYGPPETAPPKPVSDTWIRVVRDYRERGRRIDIVFQKDVEAVLEKYVSSAPSLLLPCDAEVVRNGSDYLGQPANQATQRFVRSPAFYAQKARLVPSSELVIDEYGTLVKYKGSEKYIILPEGIKAIGKQAFWDHWSLVSIILPEGVQEIGNAAFYGRDRLRYVAFPSTLRTIEKDAFTSCDSLTEIVLPEGLERIGQEAFAACTSLESITFPGTLRTISKRAFQYCTALKHVEIPEGVKTIGDYVFMECYSIEGIRLPGTLRAVSKYAFRACQTLKYVEIPEGIETIDSYAFMDCYSLAGIDLPSTLRKIGNSAFNRCSSLESVVIPEGVESISSGAFALCEQLKSVVFVGGKMPDVPFTFGESDFILPGRLRRIGKEAFKFCHSLKEIDIPEGIKSIEPMTFAGCVNLAKVTLPSTLRNIGASAFSDCQALET